MGIKWRDFQMPKSLQCDESTYTSTYGKFIAEPFERGYGVTLGNCFRRILLSSIEGAAVTAVKIDGVLHEFSTIEGVLEDVTEIILNVKKLVLRSELKTPKWISVKRDTKGEIKAKDIQTDLGIEIVNKDSHICTLTKDIKFHMELEVSRGRGYLPAEMNKKEDSPIGVIAVDSIFTPVTKVAVHVENTRVGQRTDYDRLILEIWTNGAITPKDAIVYAANIFSKHLEVFLRYGEPLPAEEEVELSPEEIALYEKLRLPISELELSVRSSNCLREANIKTIADLVQKSEDDLLSFRNFGKKSLSEIKMLLSGMGLSLGMKVDKEKLEKLE
jgi:DNA-directed RNA polymerase subunit alpha